MKVNFGKRTIGVMEPVFVIAEISANHNGSLDRAVAIARRIAYPTLTWQAADLLARANLALGAAEKAGAAARLAQDTVAAIAAAAPEPSLADTLWHWPRVLEMQETVERVRRM